MNSQIKTEWDLKQFYNSPDDPNIEKDIKKADKLFSAFEKKYKNSDFTKNENTLLQALNDFEKISALPISKPILYLSYAQTLNSSDEVVRARLNLASQAFSKISNKIVFFDVRLSKVDKKIQKKFLSSKKLSKFNYLLKKTFESGKYTLSEPEEKILTLKSITSRGLWEDLTDKLLHKLTVSHNGKEMPISEAMALSSESLSRDEREVVHKKCMQALSTIAEIAEGEINAIVTDKKINDELRGYKEPYDATILGYENDRKSVLNMTEIVTKKFNVSQKFYQVKAKMMGISKLGYFDRAARIGSSEKSIPFDEAYQVLSRVFGSVSIQYKNILEKMAENGQIDAFPKIGKAGGAFCSGDNGSPTMVMLNHTNNFHSLMTFAHEMGHAIHTELSKSQPSFYQHYSTSTAEVASTLFESFAFYDALERMSEDEKIIALHDKISDDISTIFRQIACFNFEAEMHREIREKGNLSKEELSGLMNKHMKSYLGDAVELEKEDGLFFVSWSHIRNMFYVYTYAFGQLASKALYEKYSEDKRYIEKINKFLSLGGSMSPEAIFKSIGIDVKKSEFWIKGIESIEKDINKLEKLVENKKL